MPLSRGFGSSHGGECDTRHTVVLLTEESVTPFSLRGVWFFSVRRTRARPKQIPVSRKAILKKPKNRISYRNVETTLKKDHPRSNILWLTIYLGSFVVHGPGPQCVRSGLSLK